MAQENITVHPEHLFQLQVKAAWLPTIRGALGRLPFDEVVQIIDALESQLTAQRQQLIEMAKQPAKKGE